MLATRAISTIVLLLISLYQSNQSPEVRQARGKNGISTSDSKQPLPPDRPAIEPTGGGEQVNLAVDLVVLDALVLRQKTGSPVGSLKQEDFVLQEDGVQQQITHFGQDALPLSVIFMVDRGGCLDPFSQKVRRACQEAMIRLKPDDEVALMAFANTTDLVTGFTTHRERIVQGLDHLPPHDEQAEHCFSEAFFQAADYMRRAGNPDGRRVIVFITAVTTGFDCGGHSGEEARQAVMESGSVVCGIIPRTAGQQMENGLMHAITTFGGSRHKTSLKQFADDTGGEILTDKPDLLDQTFATLMEHLRTRYAISFVSTNTKRDGSFRKLKLDVAPALQKPDDRIVVKTRKGYIASRR